MERVFAYALIAIIIATLDFASAGSTIRLPDSTRDGLNVTNVGKVVGGTNATKSGPYGLFQFEDFLGFFKYTCGCSYLGGIYALTAAHCAESASGLFMEGYVTFNVLDTTKPSGKEEKIDIVDYKIHQNYNGNTMTNDIAIIELSRIPTLALANGLRPVTLPPKDMVLNSGTPCTVTGLGTTSEGGSASPVLLEAPVDIVSNPKCNEMYKNDPPITPDMLCAAKEGKDSCQGDSGGPLVLSDSGIQVGVVSWGYGCARPEYPGVYTRVSHFRDWIAFQTGI